MSQACRGDQVAQVIYEQKQNHIRLHGDVEPAIVTILRKNASQKSPLFAMSSSDYTFGYVGTSTVLQGRWYPTTGNT